MFCFFLKIHNHTILPNSVSKRTDRAAEQIERNDNRAAGDAITEVVSVLAELKQCKLKEKAGVEARFIWQPGYVTVSVASRQEQRRLQNTHRSEVKCSC